ncbi:MAG: hypothetical protein AB7Q29_09820 [Vicinamibacterales bacterium]
MLPSAGFVVDAGKIPVRNAWYLLLYAWDLARWKDRWNASPESAPNLLGLLARVLVECTSDLLRRQLSRSHQVAVRETNGIRGRIDFATSLKRMSFISGRSVCAFPELTVDTNRNRLIRATLDMLLTDPRVEAGSSREHVLALRHDIRALLSKLEGVSSIRIQAADFNAVQLGRNDDSYRLPLELCRLINRCEMPTEAPGDQVMGALVRDEIVFSSLFERFVRAFLKQALPDATVTSETLSWHDDVGSRFAPRMRTDITIEHKATDTRLVIDTKYYAHALSSRYDSVEKFHSAHLYQLYAYLRTQEHRGDRFRNCPGILLYPTTSSIIDERMRVQGHDIRVATIDLAKPWTDIERDLLAVAGTMASGPAPVPSTTAG